jgi:septal ring factor EnvC (AmiA/AmiB activator)
MRPHSTTSLTRRAQTNESRSSGVREDLRAAVEAVEELQSKALQNKKEHDDLKATIDQLKEEKATTETLLQVPEDSLARVLARANSRGRTRGIIEGGILGLLTGSRSSLLVWYLTK